ncbi:MAG: sulfite reductase subunit beta [Actinomycetota bacterium]|nr:sulfite reductase subunit beta [Actinomycetota bacterium]
MNRTYVDRCPGVLRPWIADDGALIRLRLIGGQLGATSLRQLVEIAAEYGDTNIYLTSRANLQLRAIAHEDGCVPAALVYAISAAGLLPAPSHELVRNINVSPLTGRVGGRADLRPLADAIDKLLCADPVFASLAGRFLFSLDDGRGDVGGRTLDLGVFALDAHTAQLRVGSNLWGPTVDLNDAESSLLELAREFLDLRGGGDTAWWHVDELPGKGAELLDRPYERDERTLTTSAAPPFGKLIQDDGRQALHIEVPDGTLTPQLAGQVAALGPELIVTPWRSVIVPDLEPA